MKKVLISLLILVLCVGLTACGNNESLPAIEDDGTVVTDTQGGEAQIDNPSDNAKEHAADGVTVLKTTDIQGGDYYDFGIIVDPEYDAEFSIERLAGDKLSGNTGNFEKKLKEIVAIIGGDWDVMCDYDDDPDFGEMLMADAIREGNPDDAYMQLGCYEDTDTEEYVYYVSYCSENMDSFDRNLEKTINEIKTVFGVTVDAAKLKEASRDVFERVKKGEEYCIYEQDAEVAREDCTETVAVTMEAGYPDEGDEIIAYVYCERAKLYKK